MPNQTGLVVRLHGHHAWIDAAGIEYKCNVRGKFKQGKRTERSPVAVGDVVEFTLEGDEAVLQAIGERCSGLYRAHPRHPNQRQVLAANIDLLVIVAGADNLDEQLLTVDRLLISAYSQGLTPLIVINKMDVAGPRVLAQLEPYAKGGIVCHFTSVKQGILGPLKEEFANKVAVFAGPSGVGKTSIMNALEPGLGLRVGEVDREGEGRHTTTNASLLPMAGGYVIDTPGVRDFGFWNVELHEVSLYYPDWQDAREKCRFATCTHRHEPGCGVKAAVEAATLNYKDRYQRYLTIMRETWNEKR